MKEEFALEKVSVRFKNKSEAAGYLAGVIDGEGYISYHPEVVIVNTDLDIIRACAEACIMLGIDNWYINKGSKPSSNKHTRPYRFILSRYNSFAELRKLPLRSQKKIDGLKEITSSCKYSRCYKKEIVTLRELREGGLSLRKIAKRMNRHYMTIWRWCKKFDIPKYKQRA